MKSMQIIGANNKISTPSGDDVFAITDGHNGIQTCWTPSPEELENLKAGGYVRFNLAFTTDGKATMSADCIHPFPPDK